MSESSKKKGRKVGRNKVHAERYRARGRRTHNRVMRMLRTLARQPRNRQLWTVLHGEWEANPIVVRDACMQREKARARTLANYGLLRKQLEHKNWGGS